MGAFAAAIPFIVGGAQVAGGIGGLISGGYQAKIAEHNAVIADKNAQWAEQFDDINATNESLKTRAAIGDQVAKTSASGVDSTSGSAASVTEAQRALGQFSALTIRSNAAREAFGLRTKAAGYRAEGQMDKLNGVMDLIKSVGGAAGSFLGNAQSVPGAGTPAPYDFGKGMIGVSQ